MLVGMHERNLNHIDTKTQRSRAHIRVFFVSLCLCGSHPQLEFG
jgi:hypothetical protein